MKRLLVLSVAFLVSSGLGPSGAVRAADKPDHITVKGLSVQSIGRQIGSTTLRNVANRTTSGFIENPSVHRGEDRSGDVSANVLVNDPALDDILTFSGTRPFEDSTQSETSVAVFGNHVLVGYNSTAPNQFGGLSAYSISHDGGRTFTGAFVPRWETFFSPLPSALGPFSRFLPQLLIGRSSSEAPEWRGDKCVALRLPCVSLRIQPFSGGENSMENGATRVLTKIVAAVVLGLAVCTGANAQNTLLQCKDAPPQDPTKVFRSGLWKQWLYWAVPGPAAFATVQRIVEEVNASRRTAQLPTLIARPFYEVVVSVFDERNARGANGSSVLPETSNYEAFLATFVDDSSGGTEVLFLTDPIRSSTALTTQKKCRALRRMLNVRSSPSLKRG